MNENRRPDVRKVIETSQWTMGTDARSHYPACALWEWGAQAHMKAAVAT